MAHKHRAGAELVTVGAARRRVGDPLPGCRLHELAQHTLKPMPGPDEWNLSNACGH
jgi:hypothetical protein